MINVNKVYRSVLSIINKEQRGYLTPDQFNKIARQVQLDIFENTFYEYNKSLNNNKSFKINEEYANTPKFIKEKIDLFSTRVNLPVYPSTNDTSGPGFLQELPKLSTLSTADQMYITFKLKLPTYNDLYPTFGGSTTGIINSINSGQYKFAVSGTFNDSGDYANVTDDQMSFSRNSTDILEFTRPIDTGSYSYRFIVGNPSTPGTSDNLPEIIPSGSLSTTIYGGGTVRSLNLTYTNDIILPLATWGKSIPQQSIYSPVYRIIGLSTNNNSIIEVSKAEANILTRSKLTKPTNNYPVYCKVGDFIEIYPSTISSVNVDYIRIPVDPKWGYITAGVAGNYQYNSASSIDFEIHPSEETTLILGILQYAGVTIKDPDIVNVATSEKTNKTTIENQ